MKIDNLTEHDSRYIMATIGNKKWRLEHLYKIKNKRRETVNLVFNPLQEIYWNTRTNRDLILKARKIGFSTLCLVDDLDDTIFNENFTAFIMAHKREDVQKLFQIVHFAYDRLPAEFKPKADYYNKNELYFKDLNSRIYVGTEGRSDLINKLHVSEVAFIEDVEKRLASTFEAVPEEGSIVLETTPNGMGGHFYDLYQMAAGYKTSDEGGQSEFKAHFYPWFKHPEYKINLTEEERAQVTSGSYLTEDEESFREANNLTYSQMKWQKIKKARLGDQFPEQYPSDDLSCFIGSGQSYFDLRALQTQLQPRELVNA